MTEISNGDSKIQFKPVETGFQVSLPLVTLSVTDMALLEELLADDSTTFLKGRVSLKATELQISYDNPHHWPTLSQIIFQKNLAQRLQIAIAVVTVALNHQGQNQVFWHPDNLLWAGDNYLQVAHRGVAGLIEWHDWSSDNQFQQVKAMVTSLMMPQLDYELLSANAGLLRYEYEPKAGLLSALEKAENLQDLSTYLNHSLAEQISENSQRYQRISKVQHRFYQWGLGGLLVLVITLLTVLGYGYQESLFHQRVIKAQAQFQQGHYQAIVTTLKQDDPQRFDQQLLYITALAYAKLDVKDNPRQPMSSNIVLQSPRNYLLYWVYLGRSQLQRAISIAKGLGNSALIVKAYQQLIRATERNEELDGEEKEKQLNTYQREIDLYNKKLGENGRAKSS